MSLTIPITEPIRVVQGTTWQWSRLDLSDFPSSSWDLAYRFHSQNPAVSFTLTAVASGTGFSVTESPATTANRTPSDRRLGQTGYFWQAIVTNSVSGEKCVVGRGVFDLEADLAAQPATYDPRTVLEKRRDDLVIALNSITPFQSYTMPDGRSVNYRDREKLVKELSQVNEDIRKEQEAQKLGVDVNSLSYKPIGTRFLR